MEWRGDLDRNGGLAILMFDTQAVLDGVLGRSKRGPEKEAGKRDYVNITFGWRGIRVVMRLKDCNLKSQDVIGNVDRLWCFDKVDISYYQMNYLSDAEIALQASVLLQYLHLAQIGVSTILVKGALEMQPYNLVERTIELKAII
ncbi:hypothetical protein SERLADRAFT_433165 [Serpula lacrymans var. lacrymans S7.9]|uniref:Uncharacterized protein n=1 Tax=Serpula lacrymans var. lacrymans (strain S7.9) TaxID=578457 RepID=F8NHJ7_SERL9|nr:uncharacterized protein SERLADRAFT_433165 [Serpula lacrymans var. lacrymans S7.9]EGO29168.1 hypothetical protein SERLADRAFT_433165 [Serpula lacrymans var. lacrymans S7.9]